MNSGDQSFLSNQILPPIAAVTNLCQANLGESTLVNFSTLPGQHSFLVGPGMRVTGIAKSGSDINVSWQTAVSTNWSYQLQRTSVLTTNTSWGDLGSPTNGTGDVITQTDPEAATNKPALFYRVKQTPLCP